MKTVFSNGLMLLPGHRFARGTLAVEAGRIVAVTDETEVVREPGVETIDCTGMLVMPGLVNCHGHTAMTLLRGVGGGLPLQRWLNEAIFPVEARMTPADVAAGMTWGCLEMLAGGTTCVADMYDFPRDGAEVLARTGLKANLCRVGLSFSETEDAPPGRLDECVAFVRDPLPGAAGQLVADVCIHSEYLTNERFCRALAEANASLRRPVHVHLSETESEHGACLARHGATPAAYLASTGLFDHGGYAAHGVWCTDADFGVLREHGVALVHNPSSNLKLGSGFARVPAALAAGVRVALGTDGCASNDNLDLFEEMHVAALLHKGIARDPSVLDAWALIDAATIEGARALGRDDIGALAPGMRADLCLVDLDRPHLAPCLDPANLVVYSMKASDVAMTFVDGRLVYDARRAAETRFPHVDYFKVKADFLAAVRRLGLCPRV